MSLRNAETAIPEAIQRLAETNLELIAEVERLRAQVAGLNPTIADQAAERGPNYNWEIEARSLRKELDHIRQVLGRSGSENERLHFALEQVLKQYEEFFGKQPHGPVYQMMCEALGRKIKE